jgi:hypothetical protein
MRAIALAGVVVLLLVACGGDQSPVEVLRLFMDAVEARDVERAEGLVCEAQRSAVRQGLEPFGEVAQLDEAFDLSFGDLEFEERSNDGSTAVVRVGGSLTLSFLGQEETQEVDEEHIIIKENGRWVICDP